jgi:hypothetical protein
MVLGTYQKTLCIKNKDLDHKIILDKNYLVRVNKTKFLGISIDENLTWKDHIENVSKNMSRGIGIINKLKYFVPVRILHSLYCTLILPYLNYGILAWGNANKLYLDKIFKLQKRASRIITNNDYRSHSAPFFQKLNILNVNDMYKLELCTFMFKHFNNQLPETFTSYFLKQSKLHNYSTRTDIYNVNKIRTNFAYKTVKHSGPPTWNSLHVTTKKSKSIKQFRSQLKESLISNFI